MKTRMRFPRHAESIGPMWPKSKSKPNPGVRTVPPPAGRPRTQVKEGVGRAAPFSSSAMSSGRLFLDRVARQHCPSPLHRRSQNSTHSPEARAKDDISTLPGRRHFYFALTFPCFPSIFSSKNEPGDGSEAIRRRVSFLIRVFGRPTGGDGCRKHRWSFLFIVGFELGA